MYPDDISPEITIDPGECTWSKIGDKWYLVISFYDWASANITESDLQESAQWFIDTFKLTNPKLIMATPFQINR